MKEFTPKKGSIWSVPFVMLIILGLFDQMGFMMLRTLMTKYALTIGIAEGLATVLISAMSIAALVMRPIAGDLVDRLNNKWLLVATYIGTVITMLLYFVAKDFASLMIVRVLNGIFYSVSTIATVTIAGSLLPPDKMGSGIGIFGMGMVVSIAFASEIGLLVYNAFGPNGMFVTSLITSSVSLLLALLLPNVKRTMRHDVRSLGSRIRGMFAKEAIPASALNFMFNLAYALVGAFLVVYLDARVDAGIGIGDAGKFYIFWGIMLFVARPVSGKMFDKLGMIPVEIVTICCYAACTLLLAFGDSPITLYGGAMIGSFGFGGSIPALQAQAFSSVSPERMGAASSTQQIGGDLGNAVGASIYGWLFTWLAVSHSAVESYRILFALAVIPMAAAMLIVFGLIASKKKKERA